MNGIFHKMIEKNRNYFSFFLHTFLCNVFVFIMFFLISLTVIAEKKRDVLESKKKGSDDKNVNVAIYNVFKPCKNNVTSSKNGTIFYLWENGLLKLPKKNIAIPLSLVQLIKIMPLKKESLFLKKMRTFDANGLTQKNLCLFNFFYKLEHLYSFLMHDDKDIKFIMDHVYYVDIVEVFHFCGFPSVEDVEHVKTWINLKKGYTLDWLWKNLSLHFKEQGVPNKYVFFSLIAEMEKEIELPSQMSNYFSEFEKRWFLGKKALKHRHKNDWCMVKKKFNNFFSFLSSRNIKITKFFIMQMKYFDFEKMILLCDKCKCFYENRPEAFAIPPFFLNSDYEDDKLLKYNHEDIKFIATHPFYENILVLYHGRAFPSATMVRTVDNTWVNIKEGMTPEWIWDNLSRYFKNAGIPKKEVFFSQVVGVERNVEFMRYCQIIEYGLKKNNNQKVIDDYNEKNINKAYELLMFLARKKIYNALSFIDIVLELNYEQVADFCDKIIWFYSKAKETRSIIPIFLDSMEKVYLFLENNREDIEFIAQHSAYLLIVKVYFGVNFPIASCVKKVEAWKFVVGKKEISSVELWTFLAKMFTNCGVPTKKEFFLYGLKLPDNSHDIYKKTRQEQLALQKTKLIHNNTLSLLSLKSETLNDDKSKNTVSNRKKSKEKIGELLTFVIKKRIENIALIIELLYQLMLDLDDNTIADFCDKIMCFYSNTEEKRSLISSFLKSMEEVKLFLMNTNEEIEFIARHPCYSEIYKICFGVCFPSASCVKRFDTWENIVENITLVSLWKLLAKIFPGYGVPKRGTFLFHWFELSHKQHKIYEKNQVNELTLQEKKSNFDRVFLSLSLNIDMLNDVERRNQISHDQGGRGSEVWNEKVIDKINALFTLLEDKKIEDIPLFMDTILQLNNDSIDVFCSKVMLFYANNGEKRAIVTIFLNSIKKVNLFLNNNSKKNIEWIAQHSHYLYISEVYRGVDFPNAHDIKAVGSWKNIYKNRKLVFLWKLLAKVFAGYGVPSEEMFFFFYSCCDAFYEKNQICEKNRLDKLLL